MRVTFLRTRPAETLTEAAAVSRRREGTTAIEMESPSPADAAAAAKGGALLVSRTAPAPEAAAWALPPGPALGLVEDPSWRLTIIDEGSREEVAAALARTGAPFLRTARSRVAAAASLAAGAAVSVFVDGVGQAVRAVEEGAADLLLRDWSVEMIGELRAALASAELVERTVFPLGVETEEAQEALPPGALAAWLGQVDGSGAARPRTEWAPGRDVEVPAPRRRLSAEWADPSWVGGAAPEGLGWAGALAPILDRSLAGAAPTTAELEALLKARGDQVDAVAWAADLLRERAVGDTVTYVVNRNINYTNICRLKCGFCAFSKGPRDLRGRPYLMGPGEIAEMAAEAWGRGASEVTLQGGIHPALTGSFLLEAVKAIKAAAPGLHVHGLSPEEIRRGAETSGVSVRRFLEELRDAGLGSIPGTAAEILDDDIRRRLCPDKVGASQWADVVVAAHELGLRSSATIMFGHIDHPRSWARHLEAIREIQRRTGGFTEMAPLPFVHMESPIFLRGEARPGPTWDEAVLVHAVARIAFDGLIDNIQASWVKLGLDGAGRLLGAGCNDLGGTLMGEAIGRAAGAEHGQEACVEDFRSVIESAGRAPAQRGTTYEILNRV